MSETFEELFEKIDKLERDNKVLKEACEFYAEPESWMVKDKHSWRKSSPRSHGDDEYIRSYHHERPVGLIGTVSVGGKRARQALSKIRSEG